MTVTAAGPSYRAAGSGVVRVEALEDGLTAVFHRSSGITHLLAEPAPQILETLADDWLGVAALLSRLAERFDLGGGDLGGGNAAALVARLRELVEAGLVEERPA